jgi:uncharacterized membrane protein
MLIFAHAAEGWQLPPLHPLFVNFTAALIPVSFVFDLLGAWLRKDVLRAVGWWTLACAAFATPFTVLFGWLWFRSMGDADQWQMPIHQWLGTAAGVVVLLVAAWRGWMYRTGRHPNWMYGVVGCALLAALVFQADLGASMSFGSGVFIRHSSHD